MSDGLADVHISGGGKNRGKLSGNGPADRTGASEEANCRKFIFDSIFHVKWTCVELGQQQGSKALESRAKNPRLFHNSCGPKNCILIASNPTICTRKGGRGIAENRMRFQSKCTTCIFGNCLQGAGPMGNGTPTTISSHKACMGGRNPPKQIEWLSLSRDR